MPDVIPTRWGPVPAATDEMVEELARWLLEVWCGAFTDAAGEHRRAGWRGLARHLLADPPACLRGMDR